MKKSDWIGKKGKDLSTSKRFEKKKEEALTFSKR